MTLNEYQQQAMTTCLPEAENFTYMMLNLVGEVKDDGEEFYKRVMLSVAERSADWAKEHATSLALAKVGSKMKNYGNN